MTRDSHGVRWVCDCFFGDEVEPSSDINRPTLPVAVAGNDVQSQVPSTGTSFLSHLDFFRFFYFKKVSFLPSFVAWEQPRV